MRGGEGREALGGTLIPLVLLLRSLAGIKGHRLLQRLRRLDCASVLREASGVRRIPPLSFTPSLPETRPRSTPAAAQSSSAAISSLSLSRTASTSAWGRRVGGAQRQRRHGPGPRGALADGLVGEVLEAEELVAQFGRHDQRAVHGKGRIESWSWHNKVECWSAKCQVPSVTCHLTLEHVILRSPCKCQSSLSKQDENPRWHFK